jgi:CarD family transcriptional regulator
MAPKSAASKAAVAAILALKRKSALASEGRGAGSTPAPQPQPAPKKSSILTVAPNELKAATTNLVKAASGSVAGERTERLAAGTGPREGVAVQDPSREVQGKALGSPAPRSEILPPGVNKSETVDGSSPMAPSHGKATEPGVPRKPAVTAPKAAKGANVPHPPFKLCEFVVYPAHGVGQIIAIEEQEVAGFTLELFVLSFVKDKMILKVPVSKAASVGMRKLSDAGAVKVALGTLSGRARIKRTMWSRRAQEYEAKINSGDLTAIAEVVRDLYRSDTQPEQSYSERQLYEAALDRMAREVVAVQKLTETEALKVIEEHLQKGPRRGKAEDSDADESDIEEAA